MCVCFWLEGRCLGCLNGKSYWWDWIGILVQGIFLSVLCSWCIVCWYCLWVVVLVRFSFMVILVCEKFLIVMWIMRRVLLLSNFCIVLFSCVYLVLLILLLLLFVILLGLVLLVRCLCVWLCWCMWIMLCLIFCSIVVVIQLMCLRLRLWIVLVVCVSILDVILLVVLSLCQSDWCWMVLRLGQSVSNSSVRVQLDVYLLFCVVWISVVRIRFFWVELLGVWCSLFSRVVGFWNVVRVVCLCWMVLKLCWK